MKQFNFQIIIGLSVVFILIFGFFVLMPKSKELTEAKFIVEEKQSKLKYKEDYTANINQLAFRLADYQEELLKIDSALPNEVSLPEIFSFFQRVSSQSGLILKGISSNYSVGAKNSETPGTIKEVGFNMTVLGSYSDFKDFIEVLENSAHFIEVKNISFGASEEEDQISFALGVKIFSY